jgi:hypothetical protein
MVPLWSVAVPVVACLVLALSSGGSPGWILLSCAADALLASVVAAVHHAEVIAHREVKGGPNPHRPRPRPTHCTLLTASHESIYVELHIN